jgi:hypothetical protein
MRLLATLFAYPSIKRIVFEIHSVSIFHLRNSLVNNSNIIYSCRKANLGFLSYLHKLEDDRKKAKINAKEASFWSIAILSNIKHSSYFLDNICFNIIVILENFLFSIKPSAINQVI